MNIFYDFIVYNNFYLTYLITLTKNNNKKNTNFIIIYELWGNPS